MRQLRTARAVGYLYRRGRVWWGRVRLAGKEHRYTLRTDYRFEAAERLKGVRKRLEREQLEIPEIESKKLDIFPA